MQDNLTQLGSWLPLNKRQGINRGVDLQCPELSVLCATAMRQYHTCTVLCSAGTAMHEYHAFTKLSATVTHNYGTPVPVTKSNKKLLKFVISYFPPLSYGTGTRTVKTKEKRSGWVVCEPREPQAARSKASTHQPIKPYTHLAKTTPQHHQQLQPTRLNISPPWNPPSPPLHLGAAAATHSSPQQYCTGAQNNTAPQALDGPSAISRLECQRSWAHHELRQMLDSRRLVVSSQGFVRRRWGGISWSIILAADKPSIEGFGILLSSLMVKGGGGTGRWVRWG